MTDYISRADAIEAVRACDVFLAYQGDKIANNIDGFVDSIVEQMRDNISRAVSALPSADAEFADLPDIPRAYYERIVGNMAHEINMLKEQLESADAVQGEWIEREDWNGDYYYDCSVCGESFVLCDGTPSMNLYHFCPNCGARMIPYKGGDDE